VRIGLCIKSHGMRYAVVLAALLGCSSSNFEVAASPDTAVAADTGAPAADSDSPLSDSHDAVEASPPDTSAPCTELVANPPTVYVDKRSTRQAKGTSDCPFKSIKDGLAFVAALPSGSGKHTVQVVGGIAGAPLVYDEPMLVIKPQTELRGDGADRVVITGGSACGAEGAVCMVVMEGNTALEGFTIDAKGANKTPLAIGAGVLQWVFVKSTTLRGAGEKASGMFTDGYGILELGPELKVIDNVGGGITVKSTGSMKLNGLNQIKNNAIGIYMLAGQLDVVGPTEISANKSVGLALAASDKRHSLDGAIVADNASYGVYVDGGSMKIRRSKIIRNDIGLLFRYGASNDLDLGTLVSPGDNTFGGKLELNKRAAICLPMYRATTSPARGNTFNVCPPIPVAITEGEKVCDALPAMYNDVYYGVGMTTASNPPLDITGCSPK
jgi:hypothetical protein